MATKDKKDKKYEFPSPGGSREVGQKLKQCKNTEIPHLGSLPLGGQTIPGLKLDNNSKFWNLRP